MNTLANWIRANFANNFSYDIARAIFHYLRQQQVFVEVTAPDGTKTEENLNGGEYWMSETLARILAEKEGGSFYDYYSAKTKVLESGQFPLISNALRPAMDCMVANPSPDPTKKAANPVVLAPGMGWVIQELCDDQKSPEFFQPIGEPIPVDSGAPGDIEDKYRNRIVIAGPPEFKFPNPVNPSEPILNPAKSNAEWANFKEEETKVEAAAKVMVHKAMAEAEVEGRKAYTNNTFIGCARVAKTSPEWKAVEEVAARTVVQIEKPRSF